ncbi:HNH endonuclease signature motif containing protein [Leptothoe sp. LEGE 181152]|nr:HNH endonuclease signature motif containing protein [Leptothoe sp. LEGE 181152]
MVSEQTRRLVQQRAKYLCEYCHSPEYLSPDRFEIDHIQPRSLDGSDQLENFALACRRCNLRRYNFIDGIDPTTQKSYALFNPRIDKWTAHFAWIDKGLRIEGLNSKGRATCNRLDMNDNHHDAGAIINARKYWIQGGWHPPAEDVKKAQ